MALKVHVMGDPGSPALFCLHGFAANAQVWRPLAESLAGRMCVHAVDLPGCGESPAQEDLSLEALIEALLAVAPPSALWVGWSLGGMLALRAAAQAGPARVRGVVSVAASLKFVASADWPQGVPPEVFDGFVAGSDDAPALLRRFAALELMGDPALRRHLKWLQQEAQQPQPSSATLRQELAWLAALDLRATAPGLDLPVLHLLSGRDAVLPVDCAAALRRGCPSQRVEVLPQACHASPLTEPTALAQAIATLARPRAAALQASVARAFSRAATVYEERAQLQRRLAQRLLARLPAAAEPVDAVLDLGCGTGYCLPALQQAYPAARVTGLDLAPGMLAQARLQHGERYEWVCAAAEQMPLPDASVDLVFSSLAIQWCESFPAVLAEVHRVLRPGGRFIVNTLAEGTLQEIAAAWAQVDDREHVHRFPPEAQMRAEVSATQWQMEWSECFDEVDAHPDVRRLVDSIKGVGAHHMRQARAGLGGRRALQAWMQALEAYRTPAGLPARYRVLALGLRKKPETA